MSRIKEVVEEYYDDLSNGNTTYTEVADKILEQHPYIGYSHRTLRYKVSEIYREMAAPRSSTRNIFSKSKTDLDLLTDYLRIKPINSNQPKLQPYLNGDLNNVIVIGDPHEPFTREGYRAFCREQQEKYNCGTVVCIGDIVDNHYSSFHDSDPDGQSAGDELESTIIQTKEWHRIFPNAYCTIGNHDAIIMRRAFSSGLSSRWIKGLSEVLEMPTWKFVESVELNGVLYTHTLGGNLLNAAMARRQSVVCGHLHTVAGVQWNVSSLDRIFAMQVGCGIDDKAYAFAYAKLVAKKSVVSCGVVVDGIPTVIPMQL
jgi:hypothetical protein